jgi:hypothetical protein
MKVPVEVRRAEEGEEREAIFRLMKCFILSIAKERASPDVAKAATVRLITDMIIFETGTTRPDDEVARYVVSKVAEALAEFAPHDPEAN